MAPSVVSGRSLGEAVALPGLFVDASIRFDNNVSGRIGTLKSLSDKLNETQHYQDRPDRPDIVDVRQPILGRRTAAAKSKADERRR
jgi:hypothetical protein